MPKEPPMSPGLRPWLLHRHMTRLLSLTGPRGDKAMCLEPVHCLTRDLLTLRLVFRALGIHSIEIEHLDMLTSHVTESEKC